MSVVQLHSRMCVAEHLFVCICRASRTVQRIRVCSFDALSASGVVDGTSRLDVALRTDVE